MRPSRADVVCAVALCLAGACLAMRLVGTPVIEDEQVYLFQARSLAAGHLTYPSPPLPEFFQTAHILVVPRFAAKYLPGHALLIAPFVALGVPRLEPCLMLGVTAALLFIAGRLLGLRRWAALLAGALLLGSTDTVADLARFRSQSTSVAAVAAAFVGMLLVRSDPRPARVVALFGLAMFAGFVRPFTGLALLLGAAAIVPRSRAAWALLPLLVGAAIAAVIFHATTGSWTTPPWALYARQYMPFDGPGIGPVHAPAPERGFPPHLRSLYDAYLTSRARYDWPRIPAEALQRLATVADLLPSRAALPFALGGLFWAPLWPLSLFALAYFALQLTFHVGTSVYYLELAPWLALAAAAGAQLAVRAALDLRRPLAVAACALLGAVALWAGVGTATELRLLLARKSASPYARWEPVFARLQGMVFIRYPARWDGNADLTYNEPDLQRAQLVRAIDMGARNAELVRYFPGRETYLLDLGTERVERLEF